MSRKYEGRMVQGRVRRLSAEGKSGLAQSDSSNNLPVCTISSSATYQDSVAVIIAQNLSICFQMVLPVTKSTDFLEIF